MGPFITDAELEQSVFAAPLTICDLVCTLRRVSHSVSQTNSFLVEAARRKGQKEKPEFLLSGRKWRERKSKKILFEQPTNVSAC